MAWYDDPKLREKKLKSLAGPKEGTFSYNLLKVMKELYNRMPDNFKNRSFEDIWERELEMYKNAHKPLDKQTIQNITKSRI